LHIQPTFISSLSERVSSNFIYHTVMCIHSEL